MASSPFRESVQRVPGARVGSAGAIMLLALLISCPIACPLAGRERKSTATSTAMPTATPITPTYTPTATLEARAAPPSPTATVSEPMEQAATAQLPTATPSDSRTPPGTSVPPVLATPSGGFDLAVIPGAEKARFLEVFPELHRSSGPEWLQEGVRVTYYVQSASIPRAGEKGSSGAGYAQYDVVALTDGLVVSSLQFYLDTGDDVVVPSLTLPLFGVAGVGDYWIDPKALKDAERVADDELSVYRTATTIGGNQYKAVRFEYEKPEAKYVWMFDEASGLLLFYRHRIGEEDAPRQLADSTLVERRQIAVPWEGGSLPGWVREGLHLRYRGSYSVWTIGSPAASLPYSTSVEVKRVGSNWCEYEVTDYLSGRRNTTARRVSGAAQISGAFWLPAEAIKALRAGRTLDDDPVTGAKTGASRGHRGTVVITESGEAYRTVLTYDERDGRLLRIEQQTNTGIATILIELQLVER